MLEQVALGLIGWSIGSAALLLVAGASLHASAVQSWLSRMSGVIVLVGLSLLQLAHWDQLAHHGGLVGTHAYVALLYVVAPAFYLFFRGALQPAADEQPLRLLYFTPALLAPWLPAMFAIPLSFLAGAVYAARLAALVYRLRKQRACFQLELATFAAFGLVALAILLLGLASPLYGLHAFVLGYSMSIGLGYLLVVYLLLRFPDIAGKTAEAVAVAYAVSTLTRVDREHALARLRQLLDEEKVYTDESLNLARLAQAMGLSSHQASELINTQFGVGFSRYIREHRVAAAQRMLLDEPSASVLSVGLAVGFTSQSNFYAAFREISGDVPGRYRKIHAPAA